MEDLVVELLDLDELLEEGDDAASDDVSLVYFPATWDALEGEVM